MNDAGTTKRNLEDELSWALDFQANVGLWP